MATFPSSKFDYYKTAGCFAADISDLGPNPFHRVYPDACDQGITIRSDRTGNEVEFVVDHEERDREGDITMWVLKTVLQTQKLPLTSPLPPPGLFAIIYND